jgi:hypothetical protein
MTYVDNSTSVMWGDIDTVRNLTGVSEDDYTDSQVAEFIVLAQREVNSKINTKVVREKVEYIDETRENDIDGSNTRFYARQWKDNYFGDMNYDGTVDTTDIEVYEVDSDGTETELTPSAISVNRMYFDLTSEVDSSSDLYLTYTYCPFNPLYPDVFLKQIVAYLAASYMVSGEESGSIRLGSLALGESRETLYDRYYNKYISLMDQFQQSLTGGAIWGFKTVQI